MYAFLRKGGFALIEKTIFRAFLLLTIVALGAGGCIAPADCSTQLPPLTVEGRLIDQNSKPIAAAEILIAVPVYPDWFVVEDLMKKGNLEGEVCLHSEVHTDAEGHFACSFDSHNAIYSNAMLVPIGRISGPSAKQMRRPAVIVLLAGSIFEIKCASNGTARILTFQKKQDGDIDAKDNLTGVNFSVQFKQEAQQDSMQMVIIQPAE